MSEFQHVTIKGCPTEYVKLNVGETLFYTTIGTLTKQESLLSDMFTGKVGVIIDSNDWVIIKRSGKHFDTILNFLRDGSVILPDKAAELNELMEEAQEYKIISLVNACRKALEMRKKGRETTCYIPLVTTIEEEIKLIKKLKMPVVKFQVNRKNTKNAFTLSSGDNLLKNIDLFDKLSLRYNRRITFVKTVIVSHEICCWSFHINGRKMGEVSCTSVVYTTDRKNTKIEFPESKIYEEILNLLLFENQGDEWNPRIPRTNLPDEPIPQTNLPNESTEMNHTDLTNESSDTDNHNCSDFTKFCESNRS